MMKHLTIAGILLFSGSLMAARGDIKPSAANSKVNYADKNVERKVSEVNCPARQQLTSLFEDTDAPRASASDSAKTNGSVK